MKQNKEYVYALPSVQEYQAVMQSTFGNNWIQQISVMKKCSDDKPLCWFALFKINNEVLDLVRNVWQWTRDTVEMKDNKHILFLVALTRLIQQKHNVLRESCDLFLMKSTWQAQLGLRLMRYKKLEQCDKK